MNYYEKLYDDIIEEAVMSYKKYMRKNPDLFMDYDDVDDPEYKKAVAYFSIGQDDEDYENNYCWIYNRGKLRIAKGGTHNMNFGMAATSGRFYRGWYDVTKKMISLVPPDSEWKRKGGKVTEDDIPNPLYNALKRKFYNAPIVVFN